MTCRFAICIVNCDLLYLLICVRYFVCYQIVRIIVYNMDTIYHIENVFTFGNSSGSKLFTFQLVIVSSSDESVEFETVRDMFESVCYYTLF